MMMVATLLAVVIGMTVVVKVTIQQTCLNY